MSISTPYPLPRHVLVIHSISATPYVLNTKDCSRRRLFWKIVLEIKRKHAIYDVLHSDDYQLKQMIMNSSELRTTGFTLRQALPQELETVKNLRPWRAVGARAAPRGHTRLGCVLKVWLPNGPSYQWIMTLSLC